MAENIIVQSQKVNVRIENRTRQSIPIHVRRKNGDFFLDEKQLWLSPAGTSGCFVTVPKSYINESQIENLKAKGQITASEI